MKPAPWFSIAPMLARLTRDLPHGDYLYEPKWDGFRCLAFRDGTAVDLRSRNDRPLARYFPELVEGLLSLEDECFCLDGEILAFGPSGFDFGALLARLHPAASRVDRLRRETPAWFVAFDLPLRGPRDLRAAPFSERRKELEGLLADSGVPIFLTPVTHDRAEAMRWLERFGGGGIDGVVAKHRELRYESGKRSMAKVKRERTVDCVVAGFRWHMDRPAVASLLLGLYDGKADLRHVGVASSFPEATRIQLAAELTPLVTFLQGHPWERGFGLGPSPVGRLAGSAGRWTPDMLHDWVPLRPERVCEVAYGPLDGDRFRFPAQFKRWRPDRDPHSCTFDQLERQPFDVRDLVQSA
jgi:ATP-dependent DNA ligase